MVFSASYKLLLVISFVCGWSSAGENDLALEWGFIPCIFFHRCCKLFFIKDLFRVHFWGKMPSLFISLWILLYPQKAQEAGSPPGFCTWLLTRVRVQETFSAGGVCGMYQWGLPQTLPEGVISTFPEVFPRFSSYSCDKSHTPGVCVLVESGCNRVISFLIRAKLCHQHAHHKSSHAAGYTIP